MSITPAAQHIRMIGKQDNKSLNNKNDLKLRQAMASAKLRRTSETPQSLDVSRVNTKTVAGITILAMVGLSLVPGMVSSVAGNRSNADTPKDPSSAGDKDPSQLAKTSPFTHENMPHNETTPFSAPMNLPSAARAGGIVTGACLVAGGNPRACLTLGMLASIPAATANPLFSTDTDGDGIRDEWEKEGYTVKDHKIIAWDQGHDGCVKYTSDPYNARSAGDPYTDKEKVLNHLPAGIPQAAKNPLVAIAPDIFIAPERVSFEPWSVITTLDTKDSGTSTSKDITQSDSVAGKTEIQIGATDISATASIEVTFTESVSHGSGTHQSKSNTHQDLSDSTQASTIKMAIRFTNKGTAPAYNLKGISNVFIHTNKTERMLTTIEVAGSSGANVLMPGESYPALGEHPLVLDRKSDLIFKSELIVTKEETEMLLEKSGRLVFETPQTSSTFTKIDPITGALITKADQQWAPYNAEVNAKCAFVKVNSEDLIGLQNYRVSAGNSDTPITISQAIEALVQPIFSTGKKSTYFLSKGRVIEYRPDFFNVELKGYSKSYVDNFLDENSSKTTLDAPIKPSMQIKITPPCFTSLGGKTQDTSAFEEIKRFTITEQNIFELDKHIEFDSQNPGILRLPSNVLEKNTKYNVTFSMRMPAVGTTGYAELKFDDVKNRFLTKSTWESQSLEFTTKAEGFDPVFKVTGRNSVQIKDLHINKVS